VAISYKESDDGEEEPPPEQTVYERRKDRTSRRAEDLERGGLTGEGRLSSRRDMGVPTDRRRSGTSGEGAASH
jgi:hypothetical protein